MWNLRLSITRNTIYTTFQLQAPTNNHKLIVSIINASSYLLHKHQMPNTPQMICISRDVHFFFNVVIFSTNFKGSNISSPSCEVSVLLVASFILIRFFKNYIQTSHVTMNQFKYYVATRILNLCGKNSMWILNSDK